MSDTENPAQPLNEEDLTNGAATANVYEEDDDDDDAEPITAQKVRHHYFLESHWNYFQLLRYWKF